MQERTEYFRDSFNAQASGEASLASGFSRPRLVDYMYVLKSGDVRPCFIILVMSFRDSGVPSSFSHSNSSLLSSDHVTVKYCNQILGLHPEIQTCLPITPDQTLRRRSSIRSYFATRFVKKCKVYIRSVESRTTGTIREKQRRRRV